MSNLTVKQEAFAQAVVLNGGDKVQAYKDAGYSWKNMSSAALSIEADKLYNHPKVSLRIAELQKDADIVAKQKFSITVEQRLQWLSEIVDAGMSEYSDMAGNARRENLSASTGAIKIINDMLGVGESDDDDKDDKPLNINIKVVKPDA